MKRQWNHTQAARRRHELSHQGLKNLEGDAGSTRPECSPSRMRLSTAVALVELYWPDVQLEDLIPGCRLQVVPRTIASGEWLMRQSMAYIAHEDNRIGRPAKAS